MKEIAASWVMLISLVALFCINSYIVTNVSESISEEIETVKTAIESGDTEKAAEIFSKSNGKWQKQIKKMLYIYPHKELDEIKRVIFLSDQYISSNEFETAHIRLSEAQYLLEALQEDEKITLDNIF